MKNNVQKGLRKEFRNKFVTLSFISLVGPLLAFGFSAHAALIEGHFYPLTCGENEILSEVLPMDRNNESFVGPVTRVCHGHILENGSPVEVIRYELLGNENLHRVVDFRVVETSLLAGRLNQRRSQARQVVVAAENATLGRLQFQGLSLDGRFFSLQVVNNNSGASFLNVQVPVMKEVFNMMIAPSGEQNDEQKVLRTGGNLDVWNPTN
jgi:hypothetical protein